MASSMPTSRVGGPAPTTARLGRELQRYSQDGERLLAGCVTAATLQCLPAYAGCVSLARGPACATGRFTVPVVLARWGTSLFFLCRDWVLGLLRLLGRACICLHSRGRS